MKFCTMTLGCKVNQVETEAIESALISNGNILASLGDDCDVCIINTCAVTAESVRKSRQAVRKMRKAEPEALIAVCGCLSQLETDSAVSLGADIIGGSGSRLEFAEKIEKAVAKKLDTETLTTTEDAEDDLLVNNKGDMIIAVDDPFHRKWFEELPPGDAYRRTRALLKIQDGCDNFCAYCIIPYARGNVRSLPLKRASDNARELTERGYKEIVITGIEISSYGRDLDEKPTVIDAIKSISAVSLSARLRLGSLDPRVFTGDFCYSLSEIKNLCDHFHLSLQSGCDATLYRMGRKYSTGEVLESISLLRSLFPGCGITADLIAGFPGETDEEFAKTIEFIKAARFSDMHIFPFSQRPGTKAATMSGQTTKAVRHNRACYARDVADTMKREFLIGQIGKILEVLPERKREGRWVGHSGNYIEVTLANGGEKNVFTKVEITDVVENQVFGSLADL